MRPFLSALKTTSSPIKTDHSSIAAPFAMMYAASLLVFIFAISNITATEVSTPGSRILNGHLAEIDSTKYQVSIRMKLLDAYIFGLGHICGGSLISRTVVLTAAHCMMSSSNVPRNAKTLVVAMGTLTRNVRDANTLVYDVKKYVSHPKYTRTRTNVSNDIAYIVLDGEVPRNHPTVRPIELVNSPVPEGTVCQVTGWGLTEEGTPSDSLMTVDVPIIDINVCNVGYENLLNLASQICAGYMEGDKDACEGDSGGPLVCNGKLTGIVSFGDGCGKENKPGIYTDVLYYEDWLRSGGGDAKKQLSVVAVALLVVLKDVLISGLFK